MATAQVRHGTQLHAACLGDREARTSLVEQHLPLVRALAARYRDYGVPLDDLVQEGSIGLLDALDHYDPRRGPFEPYARFRVRRAIKNAVTEQARIIRLPKQVVERRRALDRTEARLVAAGGRPTPADLAAATGLSLAAVLEARAAAQSALDGNSTLTGFAADPSAADPADSTIEHDRAERLERALARLPDRQRYLVSAQWGLNGAAATSATALARELRLSPRRTQTIAKEALEALHRELEPTNERRGHDFDPT